MRMKKLLRRVSLTVWREWVKPVLPLLLLMFAVRSSLADWNTVPSGSMQPTIIEGDRVWVNKLAYDLKVPFTTWHLAEWSAPERGDIVVFFSPHDGLRLVKRAIGLPGDTVELRAGQLYLNGAAVDYSENENVTATSGPQPQPTSRWTEALPDHPHRMQLLPAVRAVRDFGPVTVPAGQYFMMGDNRDNSFDSRFYGAVDRRRIVGRVSGVVCSFEPGRILRARGDRWFSGLE
jgi:signal peptidase I